MTITLSIPELIGCVWLMACGIGLLAIRARELIAFIKDVRKELSDD